MRCTCLITTSSSGEDLRELRQPVDVDVIDDGLVGVAGVAPTAERLLRQLRYWAELEAVLRRLVSYRISALSSSVSPDVLIARSWLATKSRTTATRRQHSAVCFLDVWSRDELVRVD